MSHGETYRVMVPPRPLVPKRLLFGRKILPGESTTDPTTASAVHDELLAHEEVYFSDDGSIEPSTDDYASATTETLSHELRQEFPVLVTNNSQRLGRRAGPKAVG